MSNPANNLKAVMNYFGITNSELAKALAVDPSLVSRWVNGQRKLKAASAIMDGLAEYILARSQSVHDIEWLRAQFENDGLPTDIPTVYRTKQNLIIWLAIDGEALRRNLGSAQFTSEVIESPSKKTKTIVVNDFDIMAENGYLNIALFLSTDEIATAVSEGVSQLLLQLTKKKKNRKG